MGVKGTWSWTFDINGRTVTGKQEIDTTGAWSYDEIIPAAQTDFQISTGGITLSKIVGLFFKSSKNITIEVNSGSSPAATLNLVADQPLSWTTAGGSNPLVATTVSNLYVTTGVDPADLKIDILYDASP